MSDITWPAVSQLVLLSSDFQHSPPDELHQGGGRAQWDWAKEMEEAVNRKRNSCLTPFFFLLWFPNVIHWF